MPKAGSDASLANMFQIFFREKIEKIRSSFSPLSSSTAQTDLNPQCLSPLNVNEITNIVKSFDIKCSPDDPVPASFLSSDLETFIPYLVDIVNLSLETGDR